VSSARLQRPRIQLPPTGAAPCACIHVRAHAPCSSHCPHAVARCRAVTVNCAVALNSTEYATPWRQMQAAVGSGMQPFGYRCKLWRPGALEAQTAASSQRCGLLLLLTEQHPGTSATPQLGREQLPRPVAAFLGCMGALLRLLCLHARSPNGAACMLPGQRLDRRFAAVQPDADHEHVEIKPPSRHV
jgi:hypothetical protein